MQTSDEKKDELQEYSKLKGIPARSQMDYNHEAYTNVLFSEKAIIAKFQKIAAVKHSVTQNVVTKQAIGLSCDKRYLKNCSICSFAYGHKNILLDYKCKIHK